MLILHIHSKTQLYFLTNSNKYLSSLLNILSRQSHHLWYPNLGGVFLFVFWGSMLCSTCTLLWLSSQMTTVFSVCSLGKRHGTGWYGKSKGWMRQSHCPCKSITETWLVYMKNRTIKQNGTRLQLPLQAQTSFKIIAFLLSLIRGQTASP